VEFWEMFLLCKTNVTFLLLVPDLVFQCDILLGMLEALNYNYHSDMVSDSSYETNMIYSAAIDGVFDVTEAMLSHYGGVVEGYMDIVTQGIMMGFW